jgi:hypothetical protein
VSRRAPGLKNPLPVLHLRRGGSTRAVWNPSHTAR